MRMPLKTMVPICLILASFSVYPARAVEKQVTDPGNQVVPASLDAYYPPQNPAPAYLLAMINMERPFSAMVSDILENDLANARADFHAFRKLYTEISDMVPEWKRDFSMQLVEELGVALESGDPQKIMPAVEKAGDDCHSCHVTRMVPVQQKYAWNEFGELSLTDPLSGRDVNFAELMLMMNTNFAGIGGDLMQGQGKNAKLQFDGFEARFLVMKGACMTCHDSERKYYVDESVLSLIRDLKLELSKPTTDPGKVNGLMESIGMESCRKCHLVHIPAAYGQQLMSGHKEQAPAPAK